MLVAVTITENDQSYLVEIKRRHRGCDYTLNKYFFSNIKYLYYKGIDIPVLNDTSLFISLVFNSVCFSANRKSAI